MNIALGLISVISALALPIGLVMLIFKRFRRRGKWVSGVSGVTLVISLVFVGIEGSKLLDKTAKEHGFADRSDQRTAEAAGISNPADWKEHQRIAKERQDQATQTRNELLKPPPEQTRFIQAIENARAAYKTAETDLQRGATRPTRARNICAAVQSPNLHQWIGTISNLSTNGDGDGILEVTIADGLTFGTMNNAISNAAYQSMIKSGTPLYTKLLDMKEGQTVRFDGSLFGSETDCYREMSLTLNGSINEPNFVIDFSRVDRVNISTN